MKLLLAIIGFVSASFSLASEPVSLPDSIYQKLAPGDIIIRKGGGPLSYQLMEISKENYSHCGVIVKENNQWKVIQSIAESDGGGFDGVQITPIQDFVKFTADSALFICRPIIDLAKNEAIVKRAFYYLEKKIPFDHRFSLTDHARFYCSELLLHIFHDVYGEYVFEIRQQHKTYVPLFATFFDTAKFQAVFDLEK